jgi:hypothetical protein
MNPATESKLTGGTPKRTSALLGLREESEETLRKLRRPFELRRALLETCDKSFLKLESFVDSSSANRVRILRENHEQTPISRLGSEEPIDEMSI